MIAQIFVREVDQEAPFLCASRDLIRHGKDALSHRREEDEEEGGMGSSGMAFSVQACGFIL